MLGVRRPHPLIVAPMAGHFATLLRHTARTMLNDHDVYITDWKNAREVPLAAGRFGVDEYIDALIKFLDKIGPGAHDRRGARQPQRVVRESPEANQ